MGGLGRSPALCILLRINAIVDLKEFRFFFSFLDGKICGKDPPINTNWSTTIGIDSHKALL